MAKNKISFSIFTFNRGFLTSLALAFITAFLCVVLSPVLEKSNAAEPTVSSSQSTLNQTPDLIQQGKALYDAGQFAEAAKVLRQAASAAEGQGDSLRQASALNDLSLAYQQLGQWPQATAAIADSLELLQNKGGGSSKERLRTLAQTLNAQGRLKLAMGQPEEALDIWQRASNTYSKAGDELGASLSLINQTQAMQALGSYRQVLDTLNEVNQNLQKQPDSLLKVAVLRRLGNALQVKGDLDKSRHLLQQSLTLSQQLHSPPDTAQALLSLGDLSRVQQDTQAALTFYQQAAAASSSRTVKLKSQLNQLSLLVRTNQLDSAKALLPQLQSEIGNLPSSHSAIYSRIGFAQNLVRLRKASSKDTPSWLEIDHLLDAAVQQAKRLGDPRAEAYALGNLGSLYEQTHQFAEAQDLTQRALILAQAINAPDIGYRWQWQLGRLLKAQGDIKGAIAAYRGAVNNLKTLRNDLVGGNPDIQFSFRDQVEPVYRQLVDLLLRSNQPSQDNLKETRETIESLQLAELDNFFREACLEGTSLQLDQVVDQEDPTAAVIYPIILPDRVAVILKLPNLPLRHYKTTIAQGEVEQLLQNLQQKLVEPQTRQETRSLSKSVYDWLIRPAEADLAKSPVKTLVFVLDGSLRNIPMASLYDGQQYLVQKFASALTPGLQLLAPKALSQQQISAFTAGITEENLGYPALNHVLEELAQIKSEVPSTTLLNQKFTIAALKTKIEDSTFPIVHLATHGQFSSQADQTFILAWHERIYINKLSDLLQSRDTNNRSPIELLVLSACQTATGDKRAVLGLAGLAVRAGARSTLATLWTVHDKATADLMSHFYQNYAKNHMSKAEALRQAQLALLKQPDFELTLDWAPYVLAGSWL